MKKAQPDRIDGVSKYYEPAVSAENIGKCLFWIIALLSLLMPYSVTLGVPAHDILEVFFIVVVLVYFATSQIVRFYLVPRAERMRRKQMLSDAFGAPLCHDKTSLYYNNNYAPSVQRLGANTMENSLFSKEITARMLVKKRLITGGYIIIWLLAFTLRHNNLEVLTWITQIVFSGEIVTQWLNLEVLHFRHERVYEQLHAHFLHNIGAESSGAIATILDSFVAYESAKSSAGILLSSRVFSNLNPELSEEWNQIRQELKMNFQQDFDTE